MCGDVCLCLLLLMCGLNNLKKMLRANKLPEILEAGLLDGIHSAVLMTVDGSIISSKFLEDSPLNETTLAAIGSSIWLNYSPG